MIQSRTDIEIALSEAIAEDLRSDLAAHGSASLLVSGGSTPIGLFQKLSTIDLDWSNVKISLVDERIVPEDHKDYNGELVKQNLIQNLASTAEFVPLVKDGEDTLEPALKRVASLQQPFSALILGMGGDGHTASLFPSADELDIGMNLDNDQTLIKVDPKTAPHLRVSFTRKALLNCNSIYVHCYGTEKKAILDLAMKNNSYRPYPISGFLNNSLKIPKIYWSE